MAEKRIVASALELQTLARRMAEATLAEARATEVFTMFCEGKGVSGATFLSIEDGEVVVSLPDIQPAKEGAA